MNLTKPQTPFDAEVQRRAQEWLDNLDPNEQVGSRHHTVPALYLRRFCNERGQLSVRDRSTGELRLANHRDLAIKDFYTVVGEDGALDGRLEQTLSTVEANAARIFGNLLSPYRPRPLDPVDHGAVVQFLAFQLTRGLRQRREIELMTDYIAKLSAGHTLSRREIESLTVLPHQNTHLEMMCRVTEHIAPYMSDRPLTLVTLDKPLLITSDEPVILNTDGDHVEHKPDCFLTEKELARRRKEGRGKYSQVVHAYPTRPSGIAKAVEVALPLTPRSILFLGPQGASAVPQLRLYGEEAETLAREANINVISQALSWVAANPEHLSFASLPFPPTDSILRICDGGSVMSRKLKAAPDPRMPRLLRHWK